LVFIGNLNRYPIGMVDRKNVMTQKRYPESANINWNFEKDANNMVSCEDCKLIILMDIRAQLMRLNQTFNCQNALNILQFLRKIELNTRKKKTKKR
jgi:hypothetical protein